MYFYLYILISLTTLCCNATRFGDIIIPEDDSYLVAPPPPVVSFEFINIGDTPVMNLRIEMIANCSDADQPLIDRCPVGYHEIVQPVCLPPDGYQGVCSVIPPFTWTNGGVLGRLA